MSNYPKRLIEVDLPIKRISAHARREKSIRHGHISTLHIWWARRPLAACRAVICAALWPDPADPLCPQEFRNRAAAIITKFAKKAATQKDLMEHCSNDTRSKWVVLAKPENRIDPEIEAHMNVLRNALLDFIADFANWDNSTQIDYLEASRALTQAAHEALGGEPGTRPLIVDPFAGGGSIPLEALRVGGDAFASDLNPVAVLLNKVVLEYIPKYGQRLADEVRKWGEWIKKEAEKELAEFYPKDPGGAAPIAYLWTRTIKCEGPGCGAEVPLMRSLWLAKKGSRSVALRMIPNLEKKRVDFEIIENAKAKDVVEGTVQRGSATCPVCGYTTPVASVRKQLKARRGGASDARLFCVVTTKPNEQGRFYRLPTRYDLEAVRKAAEELKHQKNKHSGPLSLVPDEPIPLEGAYRIIKMLIYGSQTWEELFTPRQLLGLSTMTKALRTVDKALAIEKPELVTAIKTCLALLVDRIAAQYSSLAWWQSNGEFCVSTFARQALPIVWDFCEIQPVGGGSGDLTGAIDWIARVCEQEKVLNQFSAIGHAERSSAVMHPLPNDGAPIIVTDPPYYDAIAYGCLSDYFYVWLKRTLASVYPDLFRYELVPKKEEIIADLPHEMNISQKDIAFYERELTRSFTECRRVVQPDGIGAIVFASKSTASWEAILQAILNSGWVITASWPIDTERQGRVSAVDQARLQSSIHIVCRPRENPDGSLREDEIGDWRDVLQELPQRIHDWMPRLAQEGVVGADAIFSCLGPALEVFSRYSRVEKASGEQVTLKEYLEYVWAAVAKEALNMIFAGADATGFEEDARLTAMWLWTLSTAQGKDDLDSQMAVALNKDNENDDDEDDSKGRKKQKVGGFLLEYDAARKIAQGLGAYLEKLDHLVEIKGETARLLPVAERTRYLFGKDDAQAPATKRKKKQPQMTLAFIEELEQAEAEDGWGNKDAPRPGSTTLDRVHQAMILFAAGRAEAMKRFLVEEGTGADARFWRLAQALAALYPSGTDERRWVEGVLARKKGLGF
jgi:adenine-specific DNA methylase